MFKTSSQISNTNLYESKSMFLLMIIPTMKNSGGSKIGIEYDYGTQLSCIRIQTIVFGLVSSPYIYSCKEITLVHIINRSLHWIEIFSIIEKYSIDSTSYFQLSDV